MFFRQSTLLVACVLLIARAGRADVKDPVAAQALFDDARSLMQAGRFDEACPKLAESQRLDPGIGTQFHLADCYERLGRLASAWVAFLDVASQARANGQNDRESVALTRAARLERRLPRLTITVPEAHRVPGLEIRRDGTSVGSVQWGGGIPVDPGNHEISVQAPGKHPALYQVHAEEGQTKVFEVPLLQDDPGADATQVAPPEPARASSAEASTASAPATAEPADSGSQSHTLELALVGVGVVGLAVGTTYAWLAHSKNEDSKEHCRPDNPNKCDQQGLDLRDEALTKGNVATVALSVGGASLIAAGVIWWLEGGEAKVAARPDFGVAAAPERGGGWFVATGRF